MKLVRALVAGAVVGGVSLQPVVDAEPAAAYVLRGPYCRWSPADMSDGVGVGFDTGSTYYRHAMYTATTAAISRWNVISSGNPAFFNVVGWSSANKDLSVTWANVGASWPSAFGAHCGTSANPGWVGSPDMTWNVAWAYPSSDNLARFSLYDLQSATAVHELGHSYGLEHNTTTGCNPSTAGMMYSPSYVKMDSCTPKNSPPWNNPTTDDVNGARAAHS